MADQSLSELCTICYTTIPKYRCPRCHTQTCSLPCYKRHQQRASCNGQRNPAAYVKKSQWQTPSGIDHDYNYLKSVERNLTRAAEDTGERRAATKESNDNFNGKHDRNVAKAWREGSALQRYLIQNRIEVVKAPKGMSRQAANMTRVTNGQRVLWTVEWMGEGGKALGKDDEAAAEGTISDLFDAFSTRLKNAERKRLNADHHAEAEHAGRRTKRKRVSADMTTAQPALEQDAAAPTQEEPPTDQPAQDGEADQAPPTTDPAANTPSLQPPIPTTPSKPSPSKHFYLLRPRTSSKLPVLIPLAPASKLTAALVGRTLLEFPTVYVLDHPSDSLPPGFLLEQDYLQARKAEEQELDAMISATKSHGDGAGRGKSLEEGSHQQQQLDSNAILEMLKRDVNV